MGQYYKIVNLTKREFLYSHTFGDGSKLLEFGSSGSGMMNALAILLAEGNGRGGGDLSSESKIVGSWARDRIVVAGDYADPEKGKKLNLYQLTECSTEFKDVSSKVLAAMMDDRNVLGDIAERYAWSYDGSPLRKAVDKIKARRPEVDQAINAAMMRMTRPEKD